MRSYRCVEMIVIWVLSFECADLILFVLIFCACRHLRNKSPRRRKPWLRRTLAREKRRYVFMKQESTSTCDDVAHGDSIL